MTKEEADKIPMGTIVVGNFNHWGNKDESYLTPLVNHDNSTTHHINMQIKGKEYFSTGCLGYPRFKPVRLATEEERRWLEACIASKKTLPRSQFKPEIINEYQIY